MVLENNTTLILTFGIFVLNSVLFSGFIIPQVQKLKEIKEKLLKFRISPKEETKKSGGIAIKLNEEKKNIKKAQDILDAYSIRFKELKNLLYVFYLSVLFILIALILIFLFEFDSIVTVCHTILQCFILSIALWIYVVDPNRLNEMEYLVEELRMNPFDIIDAINFNTSIYIDKLKERYPDDNLSISLSQDIRIFGYKFFFSIYDDEKKNVYFISFGPVNDKNIFINILPFHFLGGEYNSIKIGEFPLDHTKISNKLKLSLLIFAPYLKKEDYFPFISTKEWQKGKNELIVSTNGPSPNSRNKDKGIRFKGKGSKIYQIEVNDNEEFINKIFSKYERKFKRSKKIKKYSSIEGSLIR